MVETKSGITSRMLFAIAAIAMFLLAFSGTEAQAIPKKCFGKKINRVISGDGGKHRLKFKDVAYVKGDKVTVIGKPYSRICAGGGRQYVHAGKGKSHTDTGAGNDKIFLHGSSNKNRAYGGLGNDYIRGSHGHDFLYGSPKKNPRGVSDRDRIVGLGGNDRIFDYSGEGNRLMGTTGSDRIYSLGDAVSDLYGGTGTDYLYGNGGKTESGRLERFFGEQGNDRLHADRPNNKGPAFLDAGSGDDWVWGTPKDDVIITHSGIKKLRGNAGDDLFVTASKGRATIAGGAGTDTISFEAHTPAGNRDVSGVRVNLRTGVSNGQTIHRLSGLENVIGSSFDDEIIGLPGQRNVLDGGLGNDSLTGQSRDDDVGDGGLGDNLCEGFAKASRCNGDSPGDFGARVPLVGINEGGILTIMGSDRADGISVGYDDAGNRYAVTVKDGGIASGLCTAAERQATTIFCPADANSLNGMLIYGNDGDDDVSLQNSIPETLTTTINGGDGSNRIIGGPSKDFISTSTGGSAGSLIEGRGNPDILYINDDVIARGGDGADALHVVNPCVGGVANGGKSTDSTVLAGADLPVYANLAAGVARWRHARCGNSLKIDNSVEKLEGSRFDDHLILGKRMKAQQGKSSLLGREGRNTLDSKNGVRDTVTTGPAAHGNKVIADKKDKIIWGWGLAGF